MSYYHFICHKSHMNCSGITHVFCSERIATDRITTRCDWNVCDMWTKVSGYSGCLKPEPLVNRRSDDITWLTLCSALVFTPQSFALKCTEINHQSQLNFYFFHKLLFITSSCPSGQLHVNHNIPIQNTRQDISNINFCKEKRNRIFT